MNISNKKIDIAVCILFLILAIVVHFGRIGASINGTQLTTDACNYASMAAAMAHPEIFAKDPVYDNEADYSIHATITTPLVSMLATDDNFGLAYLKLTGIQFFLHHLTFYILGVVLLKQRWQAFAFTIIMGQVMWIEWGTFWGNGFLDHVPRSNFSTFYALFVVAALKILHKPRYWPIFMFGIGLMVYVHAISTLPTAMGFWLGFAACKPKDVSFRKHAIWLIFSGCFFLIPMVPFVLKFLQPSMNLTADDIALLKEILHIRYNIGYTEYWQALQRFFFDFPRPILLGTGIISYFLLRRLGNDDERKYALQIAFWTVGVGICLSLFLLDKYFTAGSGGHGSLSNIVRTMRFTFFFSMCLGFMALNMLWRIVPPINIWGKRAVAIVWFMLIAGLYVGGQQDLLRTSALWFWNSLDEERYEQAYSRDLMRTEMLEAIQKYTEKDALIYHDTGDRAIRYKALRPLVYNWRDPSIYYFAKDMQGLRFWYDTQKRMAESREAYIELALESNADYILSSAPVHRPMLAKVGTIVWENSNHILVKIAR